MLDTNVDVVDTKLDLLNSGPGNYHGTSLTLVRNGVANAENVFRQITYSNNTPAANVQVNWTFNDGNIGAQVTGGGTSNTVFEDSVNITGTVTYTDPDGFTNPEFSIITTATNGTRVIDATGNWTYTATANYNGSDGFTVQVTDDEGTAETQVISISVTAVNDAPSFEAVNSLDGTPMLVEYGPTIALDVDVQIFGQELSGLDNFMVPV